MLGPDEFEGTVARSEGALHLTSLEELLDTQPKFMKLDLSKESDDLYMSVFKIKEALKKWDEVSLANLRLAWDEQAIKIAELKEEVAGRKKGLAAKIRHFSTQHLQDNGDGEDGGETAVVTDGKDLVASFKAEFDFVNTSSRFAETAFLSTYKILRDIPDPVEEAEACLTICIRAQEALKSAQEQLNAAAAALEQQGAAAAPTAATATISVFSSSSATAAANAEEAAAAKYEARREELESKHQSDLSDLRAKFDLDLRNREHALRSLFERQQLDLQQEAEQALARKEAEVASLLSSLNEYTQKSIESEERENMLASEANKRREIEERLRVTLTDLGAAQTATAEVQSRHDAAQARAHAAEAALEKLEKSSQLAAESMKTELAVVQRKLYAAESELQARPPVDFSALAESVAMAGGAAADGRLGGQLVTWAKMEATIIECIRRASYEATESRVKEQEAAKALRAANEECARLHAALEEKHAVVAALERDLVAAHNAVGAGQALIKCYNQGSKQAADVFDAVIREHEAKKQVVVSAGSSSSSSSSSSGAGKAAGKGKGPVVDDGWGDDDLDVDAPVKTRPTNVATGTGRPGDVDVEKGSGGRGTAAVVLGGLDASDRMLQAVQAQRDRFMKLSHDKESEMAALRKRLERATEDMLTLRNENLELYRRLRVVRASSRAPALPGTKTTVVDFDPDGNYISGKNTPSKGGRGPRRDVASSRDADEDIPFARVDGDALDRKYLHLYEEKIDPFRLEELDRASVLARMNFLERGLAFTAKFFLADQWARHALLVYLLLVHLFALGYVMQVLNPQLISEVDAHLKAKWSKDTLTTDMESEHPDVRRMLRWR